MSVLVACGIHKSRPRKEAKGRTNKPPTLSLAVTICRIFNKPNGLSILAIIRKCCLCSWEPCWSMKRLTASTSSAELTFGRRSPSTPSVVSCFRRISSFQLSGLTVNTRAIRSWTAREAGVAYDGFEVVESLLTGVDANEPARPRGFRSSLQRQRAFVKIGASHFLMRTLNGGDSNL